MEDIKLSEDEVKVLAQYKIKSDQERLNLGNIRLQFLQAEKQYLETIQKADEDLVKHIKVLAEAKSIPADDSWVFDFSTLSFVKREVAPT
jgi:hypothetical protein